MICVVFTRRGVQTLSAVEWGQTGSKPDGRSPHVQNTEIQLKGFVHKTIFSLKGCVKTNMGKNFRILKSWGGGKVSDEPKSSTPTQKSKNKLIFFMNFLPRFVYSARRQLVCCHLVSVAASAESWQRKIKIFYLKLCGAKLQVAPRDPSKQASKHGWFQVPAACYWSRTRSNWDPFHEVCLGALAWPPLLPRSSAACREARACACLDRCFHLWEIGPWDGRQPVG